MSGRLRPRPGSVKRQAGTKIIAAQDDPAPPRGSPVYRGFATMERHEGRRDEPLPNPLAGRIRTNRTGIFLRFRGGFGSRGETGTPLPSSLGPAPDPSAAIRPWGIRFWGIAESDSAGDRIGFALRSTSLVRQVSRNDETARDMAERDGRRRQRALPAWRTVGCQTAAHQRNGCGSSRSTPTARRTATGAWWTCGAVRKTLEICARAISSVGRAPRLHRGCRQFEPVIAHHSRRGRRRLSGPIASAMPRPFQIT